MQLNNLILVPISKQDLTILPSTTQILTSPSKPQSKNGSSQDEICWKKSLSAFKKYKGKKDKQNKATKSSQNNISIIQQNQQEDLKKKVFQLVECDIKYSLFNAQVGKSIPAQQQTDYFDPNQAPFFQYGVQYTYEPSQVSNQNEQENHQFYKKLQKTTKAKQDSAAKQKKNQNQTKKKQEGNKYNSKQVYLNDPFIIIKSERKNQILECIVKNQQLKREELKKTKPIKKNPKFNRSISFCGRQVSGYSNQNSESYMKQKSLNEMDIQYSNQDYGGQLPMIEFQLCKQFNYKENYNSDELGGCTTRDNSSKQKQCGQKIQAQVKEQEEISFDPNIIMQFSFGDQANQQDQNGKAKRQQTQFKIRSLKKKEQIPKKKLLELQKEELIDSKYYSKIRVDNRQY